MKTTLRKRLIGGAVASLLAACQSQPPMPTVQQVDLPRFMGDWYVIANIPTFAEKGAHNAIESYRLDKDGTIATTFSFNADSFEGKRKSFHPRAFVVDTQTNAEWGMQFVWPIKAEYLIIDLDADYTRTVIGRTARDYVWIMARTPSLPEAEYGAILKRLADLGYDTSRIEKVPQKW